MVVDEGTGLGLVSSYGDESGAETAIVFKAQSVETASNSATEVLSWASWCDLHDGKGDIRADRCTCITADAICLTATRYVAQREAARIECLYPGKIPRAHDDEDRGNGSDEDGNGGDERGSEFENLDLMSATARRPLTNTDEGER